MGFKVLKHVAMILICQLNQKRFGAGNADIGFRLSPVDCTGTDLALELRRFCCAIVKIHIKRIVEKTAREHQTGFH